VEVAATADNATTALALARAGLAVFPCHSGGAKAKQPMPFIKWREASTTSEHQILQWWQKWPDAAVGLDLAKCGLLVIDADRHGEHDGVEAFGALMSSRDFNPDSAPLVATPNQGNHHFFRQSAGKQLGNSRGSLPAGVDVRGHGGYVIAPGTIMQDGRSYELFGDLAQAPELPLWLERMLEERPALVQPANATPRPSLPPAGATEIEDLLWHIPADCDYQTWLETLMALHAAGASVDLADQWSATGGAKYAGSKEIEKKWRSFKRSGVTGRTLAMIAERHGADLAAIAIKHNVQIVPDDGYDTRRLLQSADGTLADAETGEVVEVAPTSAPTVYTEYPPGLVGMIAQWIVDTARRPQPELAVGAALAIVGTVAGRHIQGPTEAGTALYVLALAPTGKGKETPLKACMRILSAAGMKRHLGPDQWMSMSALVQMVVRQPLALCAQDEFGGFMQRVFNRKGSTHERAIPQILRSLWGINFGPWTTPQWANGTVHVVDAPCLTIFGASTHEQFYSAMEGAAIADGTLNRFLVIEGRRNPESNNEPANVNIVPQEIVDGLKWLFAKSGDLAASQRNEIDYNLALTDSLTRLPWCPDGSQKLYTAFVAEIDREASAKPLRADFIVRAPEMAARIATIIAAGRGNDSVRFDDIEFGIRMVRGSLMHMISGADEYMSENDHEANVKRVLRIIRTAGRIGHRELLRQVRSIRSRDLKDIIASLIEDESIVRAEVETKGRKRMEYLAQ
jgi:hypothetical protein